MFSRFVLQIDEHWRQVYVDVTTMDDLNDDDKLDELDNWCEIFRDWKKSNT